MCMLFRKIPDLNNSEVDIPTYTHGPNQTQVRTGGCKSRIISSLYLVLLRNRVARLNVMIPVHRGMRLEGCTFAGKASYSPCGKNIARECVPNPEPSLIHRLDSIHPTLYTTQLTPNPGSEHLCPYCTKLILWSSYTHIGPDFLST